MSSAIPRSFYRSNDLFKFHNKNVVYIAYVGKHQDRETFKYGISCNVYNREYLQHRKRFTKFEMCWIKQVYNMAQAENLFEKELKIRNIHLTASIDNKKQTELFTPTDEYSYEYLRKLFARICRHVDKDILEEISALKKEIRQLKKK